MDREPFVIIQAFKAMSRRRASRPPGEREAIQKDMQAQIDAMKARGARLVVNPTGHRVTLAATGPCRVEPL